MSLDNIQLTPFLVQHLYKKTLVEVDEKPISTPIQKEIPIATLGANKKNILIVINESETAFLNDQDLALLVGILSACKLSLADIALLNFDKNKHVGYEEMTTQFEPNLILLFGIGPENLSFPLIFPKYQLQRYNHRTYLCAASFKVLATDLEQKRTLWACLQKYFSENNV